MIDMIGGSNKYLDKLIGIFQDPALVNYIDVFSKNSLRYLNLDKYLNRMSQDNPEFLSFRSKRYLESLAADIA